jgi:hypothetical protein
VIGIAAEVHRCRRWIDHQVDRAVREMGDDPGTSAGWLLLGVRL